VQSTHYHLRLDWIGSRGRLNCSHDCCKKRKCTAVVLFANPNHSFDTHSTSSAPSLLSFALPYSYTLRPFCPARALNGDLSLADHHYTTPPFVTPAPFCLEIINSTPKSAQRPSSKYCAQEATDIQLANEFIQPANEFQPRTTFWALDNRHWVVVEAMWRMRAGPSACITRRVRPCLELRNELCVKIIFSTKAKWYVVCELRKGL